LGGSGIDQCAAGTTFTTEGMGFAASGSCTDKAGNSTTAAKTGINIDKTPPSVAIATPTDGGTYSSGSTVNASYTCTDALAGTNSCSGTAANGSPIATSTSGSNTFTVNATDKAGNAASKTN